MASGSKWSNTLWPNAASVLLPRRWVAERSFLPGRLFPQTRTRLRAARHHAQRFHYVAFACLMIANMFKQLA